MSRAAHHTGAGLPEQARRELADIAQHEVAEARRIQQQTGCTWTEALRLAYENTRRNSA